MTIGVAYLLYLTVSCFIGDIRRPLAVMLSHAIVFQGDIMSSSLEAEYSYWTVIIFKITAFMCAICFLLLGTFIAYYKSVVKVETMMKEKKATLYCYLSFAVIGVVHSIFVITFALMEDVEISPGQIYDKSNLSTKKKVSMALSVAFQVIFYGLELFAFMLTYRKVSATLTTMLKFHDYLIEYRLTPRSRVLRKHLPKMTMVLEEESNMDQSSIMMSESR